MRTTVSLLAFGFVALLTIPAQAHKPSDSYLTLTVGGPPVAVRWDIALRDLDNVLALDRDADGAITWGELRARESDARFALTAKSAGSAPSTCL